MSSRVREFPPLRFDSPLSTDIVMSPVSTLAENLNGLTTDSSGTPKKRLSWSKGTPTEFPKIFSRLDSSHCDSLWSETDSPTLQERVLKDVRNNGNRLIRELHRKCVVSKFNLSIEDANSPLEKENIPIDVPAVTNPSPTKNSMLSSSFSDTNSDTDSSQDSGYHVNKDDTNKKFAEPTGVAPRRRHGDSESSQSKDESVSPLKSHSSWSSGSSGISIRSSLIPDEDGFDGFDIDILDDDTRLPSSFSQLLSAPLACEIKEKDPPYGLFRRHSDDPPEWRKSSIRRCLSMAAGFESNEKESPASCTSTSLSKSPSTPCLAPASSNCVQAVTPPGPSSVLRPLLENGSNVNSLENKLVFKRPESPDDSAPSFQSKRRKGVSLQRVASYAEGSSVKKINIQRSYSESEATIKLALQRSVQEPSLIGDFSKPYALPLTRGKHEDLKMITPSTLLDVVQGRYADSVDSYTIIDCRYPYEYEGGHIQGAKNIYTTQGVEGFLESKKPDSTKRDVLIFHCEFSSERGPKLSRHLRNVDRGINKESYPRLNYPEIYVLEGGYKAFFEAFKQFCEPPEYKPMRHKDHGSDLKEFRAKTKSRSTELKGRLASRGNMKL